MTTTANLTQTSGCFVPTQKASGYLQQLCKHMGHKIPASFDEQQGKLEFPAGDCLLRATETGLDLQVFAADADGIAKLQDVITRHLLRFAFREELNPVWSDMRAA